MAHVELTSFRGQDKKRLRLAKQKPVSAKGIVITLVGLLRLGPCRFW